MTPHQVCGVPVIPFEHMASALDAIIDGHSRSIRPGFAVAINPEKVIKAHKDPGVRSTLLDATFPYADGIGVVWAMRRRGVQNRRIPGCELWEALMKRCGELQIPVFLVGARPQVLDLVKHRLTEEFKTPVVGAVDGFFDRGRKADLFAQIQSSGAKVVCVAMGSPTQELLIRECRAVHPHCFYMGVGGSFDVFSGDVARAPRIWRQLNLEWLYRLLANPTRALRQVALLRFVLLVLRDRSAPTPGTSAPRI